MNKIIVGLIAAGIATVLGVKKVISDFDPMACGPGVELLGHFSFEEKRPTNSGRTVI